MKATLALVGNKIHLKIMPYDRLSKEAAKSVRGGRWLESARAWTYPLNFNTCQEIREKIGDDGLGAEIEIKPGLWKWAENEAIRLEYVPSADSLELASLPRLEKENPALLAAASNRPFQTVGISFAAAHRSVCLADEPGLGKTIQTIGAQIEGNVTGPVLVIAPKTAAELTWPAQLEYWAPDERVTSLANLTPAKRQAALESYVAGIGRQPFGNYVKRQWLVINPYWVMAKASLDAKGNYRFPKKDRDKGIGMEYKMPELFDIEWASVIVDESQDILVTPSMNRKKWIQARVGIENLKMQDNAMRMAMSGTPMRGKQENFYGTLQWLLPSKYTSYWKWVERHFHMEAKVNDAGFQEKEIGKIIDLGALFKENSEVVLRRTKLEVAKDLPPKIYGGEPLDPNDPNSPVGVWLHMGSKQRKQYEQLELDGSVRLDGGTMMVNGVLGEWTRLKQLANSAGSFIDGEFKPAMPSCKMEWILNFLNERGIAAKPDGDGKVIIASQYAEMCIMIQKVLEKEKIPSYLLIGKTSAAKRRDMMDGFMNDTGSEAVRVFILSTKAGGVSLTLDSADDVVIVDETYNPDDQLQIEDRAHRVSRPDHQVSIWYLRTLGTKEEAIAAVTGMRSDRMALILDGSRGVDIRKEIKSYRPRDRRAA